MPLAAAGLAPAHLHHEHRLRLGVRLVLPEVGEDLEAVAHELVRPVALLAGLAGRAQVVHGNRDRPRVEVEGHGDELPRPGELRLDEPVRPLSDVALHALHPRVGRALVGRELGLHDRVAGGPAELGRLHHLDALVGADPEDEGVDAGGGDEDERGLAGGRPVEVEDGELHGGVVLGERLQATLAGPPQAEGDEGEAQQEEARQDQEGQDAEVGGCPVLAHDVDGEEEQEQEGGDRGEGRAGQAHRVAGDGREEPGDGIQQSLHLFSSCRRPKLRGTRDHGPAVDQAGPALRALGRLIRGP